MAIKDAQGNDLRVGDVVAVATLEGANKPRLVIGPIVRREVDGGEMYFVVDLGEQSRHASDYAKLPVHQGHAVLAVRMPPALVTMNPETPEEVKASQWQGPAKKAKRQTPTS